MRELTPDERRLSPAAPQASHGELALHHTAIVARDLARCSRFYTHYFGGVVERVIEDVSDPGIVALHRLPEANFTVALLRFGTTRLELFQFTHPADAQDLGRRSNDLGLAHICFECPDVLATYKALSADGVVFTSAPYVVPDGIGAGTVLVFCLDSEGNLIELLQPPSDHDDG